MLNLDASLNRPGWTSTPETGGLQAFNHKHTVTRDGSGIIRDYYVRTQGCKSMQALGEVRDLCRR